MILELDYDTISALESALIVAEVTRARDAKAWRKVAETQGASEQSREAGELAAFFRRQANRYRTAMDALQKAQREAPMPDSKLPSACEFAQKKRPLVLQHQTAPKKNGSALILEGLKEIVKYEQLHNPGSRRAQTYPARLDHPGRH